jgi:hypothetical protein
MRRDAVMRRALRVALDGRGVHLAGVDEEMRQPGAAA